MDIVVAPATVPPCLLPPAAGPAPPPPAEVAAPPSVLGLVVIVDTGGGFFAILCQFGIAIAAPTAITITTMARPCAIRFDDVLMMGLSSGVVIILFSYSERVLHSGQFSATCTFHKVYHH